MELTVGILCGLFCKEFVAEIFSDVIVGLAIEDVDLNKQEFRDIFMAGNWLISIPSHCVCGN